VADRQHYGWNTTEGDALIRALPSWFDIAEAVSKVILPYIRFDLFAQNKEFLQGSRGYSG